MSQYLENEELDLKFDSLQGICKVRKVFVADINLCKIMIYNLMRTTYQRFFKGFKKKLDLDMRQNATVLILQGAVVGFVIVIIHSSFSLIPEKLRTFKPLSEDLYGVPFTEKPDPMQRDPEAEKAELLLSRLNEKVVKSRELQLKAATEASGCADKTRGMPAGSLADCLRPLINAIPVVELDYVPYAACRIYDFCNGQGTCFLGSCFCAPGWTGPSCNQTVGTVPPCSATSDACFRHPTYGRLRISLERWQRASMAESNWWSAPERATDDNDNAAATFQLFEAYKDVPNFLGHVLELGCGPFTQLRTILDAPNHQFEVRFA